MTIEYRGHTIPSQKNNKQMIFRKGSKPRLITDPKKQKIINVIIDKFQEFPKVEEYPVRPSFIFYISDRRRRDLDNMVSTILDCMVKAGIIQDDSIKFVGGLGNVDYETVEKGQEGVSVEISTLFVE